MMELEILSGSPRLLVALDFDGTLAPIVPMADRAQILEESAWALEMLRRIPGTTIAILSGRDLSDLSNRIPNAEGYWLGGSHGRTLRPPGGTLVNTEFDERLAPYRDLELLPGIRREVKEFSVTYHWRGRTGGEPTGWVNLRKEAALRDGLEVMEGRMVLEILIPGKGKESALAQVAKECEATAIVFAGDDRTDLEAIHFANDRGMGVFVYSAERCAMAPDGITTLDGPEEFAKWLGKLAFQRCSILESTNIRGQNPVKED
jgi:trehalose 6-phosphate phosphatase